MSVACTWLLRRRSTVVTCSRCSPLHPPPLADRPDYLRLQSSEPSIITLQTPPPPLFRSARSCATSGTCRRWGAGAAVCPSAPLACLPCACLLRLPACCTAACHCYLLAPLHRGPGMCDRVARSSSPGKLERQPPPPRAPPPRSTARRGARWRSSSRGSTCRRALPLLCAAVGCPCISRMGSRRHLHAVD